MPKITPLQRALGLYDDSPTRMAAALGEPVKRQNIEHWLKANSVPAEHCPAIERATRAKAAEAGDDSLIVTCEELRPDVAWSVLREQTTPSEAA